MEAKDYFYINPASYGYDELSDFRDKLVDAYENYEDMCAREYAEKLSDIDPNSFKGKKIAKKIINTYADKMSDIQIVLEMVQEELDKRDEYYEQQRYIDGGNIKKSNLSDEDFLRKEQEKTTRIRRIIDLDNSSDN